ncbi:MAG: metallophosphoesterase, partial [Myxococcota bacterium]
MRLAWLTDIHLDFVDHPRFEQLCREVQEVQADGVLIGGDIAQAKDFDTWLEAMADTIDAPIYFVLGNHDYYGGTIEAVRQRAAALTTRCPQSVEPSHR